MSEQNKALARRALEEIWNQGKLTVINDQIAEGDKVVTRWTATGTHKGQLMAIAPTNKHATVTGVDIDRYQDGKVVEAWASYDMFGLLQQLGVVPAMAPAGASA